jgi:hypothetical protein
MSDLTPVSLPFWRENRLGFTNMKIAAPGSVVANPVFGQYNLIVNKEIVHWIHTASPSHSMTENPPRAGNCSLAQRSPNAT